MYVCVSHIASISNTVEFEKKYKLLAQARLDVMKAREAYESRTEEARRAKKRSADVIRRLETFTKLLEDVSAIIITTIDDYYSDFRCIFFDPIDIKNFQFLA